MISLYPSIKKIFASAIALFAVAVASAQIDYASLTRQPGSEQHSVANNDVNASVVKIKTRTASKVLLTWAPFEGAVSHYVLERSTNGRDFYEAGLLFTGEFDNEPEYAFTDNLKVNYNGPLYYRLRVVGLGEREYTTPVTIMKRGGGASLLTH
jgi:hypothetical protein